MIIFGECMNFPAGTAICWKKKNQSESSHRMGLGAWGMGQKNCLSDRIVCAMPPAACTMP
jgi:hypothetical protein